MRDWYLVSNIFNTLALLIYNRLMKYVVFLKLLVKSGLYHQFRLLEIAVLSLMIFATLLHIVVNVRKKAGNFEDTLANLITAVSIYNLLSAIMIYSYCIQIEGK
jgi:hypothetical protein